MKRGRHPCFTWALAGVRRTHPEPPAPIWVLPRRVRSGECPRDVRRGVYIGVLGANDDLAELSRWASGHLGGTPMLIPTSPGICLGPR